MCKISNRSPMSATYNNLLIIYYSGTGNSKRVSEWIAGEAAKRGMRTHISSYHQFSVTDIAHFEGKTLIGFFSATHGFNMPHSMLRFMFGFSELKGSDVFIGNTRAGMKLWKIFMPGLSGIAMYFPALIMMLKGYRIKAMYPVDLPSNWISLHPGLRPKVVDSILKRCNRLTVWFANEVLNGKPVFLKSFILLPLDLLVMPLALGYYFLGRFMIAKTFVANTHCNNCGLCMEQCPTKSIILSDNRPYWKFTCESCMKCMNYCPHRAIETAHSLVFVLLAVLILLVNPALSKGIAGFASHYLNNSQLASGFLYYLLQWSIAFVMFMVGYRLLHFVMRFPLLNRLINYTSLTTWKFWRRYKIPKKQVPLQP